MNADLHPGDVAVDRAADFARQTELVRAELEKAVIDAGLGDDALGSVLRSLSSALQIIAEAPGVMLTAAQPVALSAENQRDLVRTARRDIVQGARVAMADAIRGIRPTALFTAAGVLFAVVAVCLAGGYWWGRSSAQSEIRQTEAGLQAAFSNGSDAAKAWWSLMAWNDPRKALAQCQGKAISIQGGRRACLVPLWVEPPPAPKS